MSGGTIRALRLAGAVAAASLVSATGAQAGVVHLLLPAEHLALLTLS